MLLLTVSFLFREGRGRLAGGQRRQRRLIRTSDIIRVGGAVILRVGFKSKRSRGLRVDYTCSDQTVKQRGRETDRQVHRQVNRCVLTCSAAASLLWQGGGQGGGVRKRREVVRGGEVSVEEVIVWILL